MNNLDFIVSLASYKKRIQTLHICLSSLFSQTLQPRKVLLYLDETVDLNTLPNSITAFISKGLEICQVSSELKSHNKYFYAFSKYKNDIIITVDDDVVYNHDLFYNLIKSYIRFPNAISASRVHYITFDEHHKIRPYQNWKFEYNQLLTPSMRLFATGVGGILYPPQIMPKGTLNASRIIDLSLDADDIWLKFMQIKMNIPVVWSSQERQHPKQIEGTKKVALYNINRFKNDEYISNLTDFFKFDLYKLLNSDGSF
jgi:hypothetical protein